MRIAVTGGRGRLAPLIGQLLEREAHDVRLYSRRPGGLLHNLDELAAGLQRTPEVIVHCAWSGVPATAELDPGLSGRADLPTLSRLVENNPQARIIFLSSAAVYGDTGPEPAHEESPLLPKGAYARNKLAAENLLRQLAPGRTLILRVSNLLGGRIDPDRPQGVLPRIIRCAREGGELSLWGDGSATKDYIDLADFLVVLGEMVRAHTPGVFNVGSGSSYSVRDLIETVEHLAGRPVRIREGPHFGWDVQYSRISIDKLKARLDWEPAITLSQSVRACMDAAGAGP